MGGRSTGMLGQANVHNSMLNAVEASLFVDKATYVVLSGTECSRVWLTQPQSIRGVVQGWDPFRWPASVCIRLC
jgi:hypothetical protein